MRLLERITIQNFKSIREQELKLGPLNVFIGANGSGKSNFIEVFRLLREIVNQRLGVYVAKKGGANALLHFGRKKSNFMTLGIEFSEGRYSNGYEVGLEATDQDALFVAKEKAYYHDREKYTSPYYRNLPSGAESSIREGTHICERQVTADLDRYQVYHFHDTSDAASVKHHADLHDNAYLRPQAENLAAFLYWLQQKHPATLALIRDTLRQVAPFFGEFRLLPSKLNEGKILLEWTERGEDGYFSVSALSDGTLRFLCLATLLLQPALPGLILLDEPELGLHPAAIQLLASMLEAASTRTQVVVATQSVTLINHVDPAAVWVVDCEDQQSVFQRLDVQSLDAWKDSYSLGELWEKNVLGGRP